MARPSEAVIDLAAIGHNFAYARACAGGREVIAVIKADAYGHGAVPMARALTRRGCGRFAVLCVEEMVALREAGIDAPVLVLAGPHDAQDAHELVRSGATAVVHHERQLGWLSEASAGAATPTPVQVELDTGMRRMGVAPEGAARFFETLEATRGLRLSGVFTHLACADETDLSASAAQYEAFGALLRTHVPQAGAAGFEVHVANSAGLLAAPALPLRGSAVRPGLMLYGARPAHHLGAALRPAMTLRTEVVALREVEAGAAVGYGGTWRAPTRGHVATLGAGYADGIPRSLGGVGEVEIDGARAPLVGRVSMDSVGAWLGDRVVAPGAPACVFGGDGPRVEEVAERAGTISYELLVGVGARVARRYVDE